MSLIRMFDKTFNLVATYLQVCCETQSSVVLGSKNLFVSWFKEKCFNCIWKEKRCLIVALGRNEALFVNRVRMDKTLRPITQRLSGCTSDYPFLIWILISIFLSGRQVIDLK